MKAWEEDHHDFPSYPRHPQRLELSNQRRTKSVYPLVPLVWRHQDVCGRNTLAPCLHGKRCRQLDSCSYFFNRTLGMVPNTEPPKKGASSYVSCHAAVRDSIRVPHISLIGSTSRIHSLNGRTERYFPTCHTFVS